MIMNKKFSTLMALALLGGSVSAQNWVDTNNSTVQGAYRTFATKSAPGTAGGANALDASGLNMATGAAWSKNVFSIDGSKWYQLEVNDAATVYADVLIQERDYETGEVYLRVVDKATAPLNASLWQIKYSKPDGVSGGYFTYVNKETGLALTLDHSVVNNTSMTELRAGTAEWSWYTVNKDNSTAFAYQKVYSYIHDQKYNQVMYLSYAVGTDTWKGGTVNSLLTKLSTDGYQLPANVGKLVKAKVADANDAGTNLGNLGTEVLEIKPVAAVPFFMTAQQFNTRMDADVKTNAGSFTFNIAPTNMKGADVFAGEFKAYDKTHSPLDLNNSHLTATSNGTDVDGTIFASVINGQFNLNFESLSTPGSYLLADTARYQEASMMPSVSPSVKFAVKTPKQTDGAYMKARYYFRATYFPTNDSIVIEPLNAAVQSDAEYNGKTAWVDSEACKKFYRNNFTKANSLINDDAFTSKTVSITAADIPGSTERAITITKDGLHEFKVKTTIDRPFEYLNRATIGTGLYFIKLTNHADRQRAAGMNIVKNMNGDMMYDTQATNQDYDLMPATMWTVKQLGCAEMGAADSAKYVEIQNREYPGVSFVGQLYSKDGVNYSFINRIANYTAGYASATGMLNNNFLQVADSFKFVKVIDPVAYTNTHGYKMFTTDELNNGIENNYNIKWNNFVKDLFVQSEKDKKSYIDETTSPVFYEIAEATLPENGGVVANTFGIKLDSMKSDVAGDLKTIVGQLDRKAYVIKIKDNNLIDNNQLYIASVKAGDGRYYYTAVKKSELNSVDKKLAYFYFKADQVRLDDNAAILDTCYVLVDIAEPATVAGAKVKLHDDNGWMKVAIEAGYKMGVLRDNDLNDKPNDVSAAFYTDHKVRPQYIDLAKDYKVNLNGNVKIYQQLAAKNYLFEDCNDANQVAKIQAINPDFHYLGVESRTMDVEKHAALYVDKVVNDYELMPRYLFGVRVDSIPDGYICNDASRIHGYWSSKSAAEGDGEVHFVDYNGYTAGWFLVNLEDSVAKYTSTNMMDEASKYKFNSYTRLGFVQGIHQVANGVDVLYILKPGYELNDLMTVRNNSTDRTAKYTNAGFVLDPAKLATMTDAVTISGTLNTNHTFSLRKVNDYADDAYNASASEPFLLESYVSGSNVGSFTGAWVKTENGVPVLAKLNTGTGDHENGTGNVAETIGQSGVFYFGSTTDEATSNKDITTSSIKVIAKEGAVEIVGAAGKKVTIANVLGQVVASTVLTSDNAVIATSAGVVVVSVEGEAAAKAIVK